MKKYLCKDCWLQHDLDTLFGTCDECGTRARDRAEPLRDRRDPSRDDVLICRHHKAEALKLRCSECKEEIPSGTFGDRSALAVVGDTGSGKTTLMWVLTSRVLRARGNGGLSIQRAIGKSDDQLRATVEPIFASGHAPTKPTDANVRNYAWELKLQRPALNGNWLLAFHDAAGEIWRELTRLTPSTHPALRRFLKLVGCVIFTIDGEKLLDVLDVNVHDVGGRELRFAADYELDIAEALTQRFSPRAEKIPVAVTVTKADVFWNREEWALFGPESGATREEIDRAVKQLLQRTGRGPLLDLLECSFTPISYFAVSAFGCSPFPGFRREDVRSSRVEEPIVTLLNL